MEENKLLLIQGELKAPKDLMNNFGGYKYRSCESILEALKPLLQSHKCLLTLTDEVVAIGNRIYVRATAFLNDISGKVTWTVTAYAREEEVKKGMDSSQITGAASSYARKYALNGLFLIDDNKDSDHTNTGADKPESAKSDPHNIKEQAKLSPSEKKITGKVTDHKLPDGAGVFHNFTVEGLELSTKNAKVIEDMTLYHDGGDTVEVIYSEKAWARGMNRYIIAVKPMGDAANQF